MNKLFSTFQYAFKSYIDWKFRIKRAPQILITTGLVLSVPKICIWAFSIQLDFLDFPLSLAITNGAGTSALLFYVGLFTMLTGIGFVIFDHVQELRRDSKRRIIVIEVRGLRENTGTPLFHAIPRKLRGNKESLVLQFRYNEDGRIISPVACLREISGMVENIKQRETGHNRGEIVRVFGGLAPVPYLFLAGVMLDDEQDLKIMDWDRQKKLWRELDDLDDLNRFAPPKINIQPNETDEVILAVSASYLVDIEGAKRTVGNIPVIQLELIDRSLTSHWPEEKQIALASTFLETARKLSDHGVKRIHLFLAAPASLSFRFGTCYDKRNLPETTIYQYERSEQPPFPWGISLPIAGKVKTEIVSVTPAATIP